MTLTRLFLLVTGSLLVVIGAAYLIAPVPLAALADLRVATPLAEIEIRGFYGGQMIGLGLFVLLGVRSAAFATPALLLLLASLGGTALGRCVGILASGSLPPAIAAALASEVAASAIALLLLRRSRYQR